MSIQIPTFKVSSVNEAISLVPDMVHTYRDKGILLVKGYKFSIEDQIELAKPIGDILNWNIHSEASQLALDAAIYLGGHSDNPEKEYNSKKDEYILDWHIEQVYFVYPVLAGMWNMTKFTAPPESGSTRFVDSCQLYKNLNDSDKEFLENCIVFWDKPTGIGSGPFYTKAVDTHSLINKKVLRVETDQGCYIKPTLHLVNGQKPSEEQTEKFNTLMKDLKQELYDNENIRYSQNWEEGDLLLVDLFRMYHAVMGGFGYEERVMPSLGMRPRTYNNDLYNKLELVCQTN